MKVTTKSLEQRLTQAQTKIEELNSVKAENETLKKKQINTQKNLDESKAEVDSLKKA
jgi:TolA-binding protein